jgi:uncharacterized tellurite resistance protein B-like protein
MFDRLMKFLDGSDSPASLSDDLHACVAVLLLEAAHRGDHFGPEDRALIERLLKERFALSAEQCAQLVAASEAKVEQLVQLQPYTHTIFTHMSVAERIQIIEMLWEVVYADGVLEPEEDVLVRRVAGLIDVTDRDRVLARQRVLARMAWKNADEAPK